MQVIHDGYVAHLDKLTYNYNIMTMVLQLVSANFSVDNEHIKEDLLDIPSGKHLRGV